jgi:HEAT repeat protein
MMSFMAEITTTSMKVFRNTNFSVILRIHAVSAFSKSLVSAGRALPDALVKDLLKNLRAGLQDKALPLQRACADAFVNLHQYSPVLPLQGTLETISPLVFKSLEGADYLTRRSLSQLLAHFLAATQLPGSGVVPTDPRKAGAKKGVVEEDVGMPQVVTSAPEDKIPPLYTPQQMLRTLSVPYNRPNPLRKLRNAIMDVYATLLTRLGTDYVETHYAEIMDHLVNEIVLPPPRAAPISRYEALQTREAVVILVRDLIGVSMLSEAGQVMAIREWANNYLRKWNPTPLAGQKNPSKQALIIALREIAGLLGQLGNAPPQVLELLAEPLVRLLSHESYSVRTAAAYTLRIFTSTNPSQLPRLLGGLLADVNKDLELLTTPTAPKDLATRILGRAVATAALVAVSPSRPLYVSNDIPTKVFDLAVSLLKRAGDHDVAVATVEVQVAWFLIAALMSLGPGFVKLHLPQLLVLWRNALSKPTSKDSVVGDRGEAEWTFLLVVRECALSAIHNFLKHNAALVNIDVARRLATLLTNTLNYVNGFATAYAELLREQAANPTGVSTISQMRPSLVDREATLRRRVIQCFTDLGPSSATETMQPALLQAAVTVIADPENYSGSAAQAAIAAQAGQFSDVWQSTDGYAFGVTSLLPARGREAGASDEDVFLNRDRIEMAIEGQCSQPIVGSIEYDYVELFAATPLTDTPRPVPAQTGVIDAGVDLFAALFAYQNLEGQVQSLATLSSHVRSSKLERNPGRRQAVVANTMEALRRSLVQAESAGQKAHRTLGSPQVSDLIKSLLQDAVLHDQPPIRCAAADAMGRLSALAGTAYLSSQVQWLVDQVVNNRVPESRAGCAVAFGQIYSAVGGLSGGPILKTIVNILMSLATDPHPVVHFYALTALTQIVNSANLSYSPYVQTTLGMIANIYLLETHEPDGGSLGSVNLRGDLPAYQIICRLLHALIGVLGPELQEPGKVRSLVFLLVHEFREETDEGLAVEAIKCIQQFLMFAPAEVDVPKLVSSFRGYLASTRRPLKVAAITALYQIVQRDAVLMSKVGGNQLVEELFGLLDNDPTIEGVKAVITSWLLQTAAALPSGWIDLCQRIMTRTVAAAAKTPKATTAQAMFLDDEAQSLGGDSANQTSALNSRWRTQLFALQCLHNIMKAAADGSKPEHFDPVLARQLGANARHMLFSRVADLIRMAFSASAALVEDVRLAGLQVLRDVIERFAASPDPDFEGSLLLEQHQAPIAAALTPSFSADSTPKVLASAVQVCAVFVGSGVVKEVSRMGRILKLLTTALEQCKSNDLLQLGDVTDLSSSASVMLKISILAAWAELEIASTRQTYLVAVLQPYRYLLDPFWVGALRDFAQLRTDPDMGAAGGMDYSSGLGRDVLLPYYEAAAPKLLHAVAIGLAAEDPFMVGAVDGAIYKSAADIPPVPTGPAIRPEPAQNFYILYGLAFDALTRALGTDPTMASVVLKVMGSLVHPQLSGTTVFEGTFFDEMCTLCYRIAMSESAAIKADMVNLVAAFATSRRDVTGIDSAQIRRALAIVAFVLRGTIPSPQVASTFSPTDSAADRVAFFKTAFAAYVRIVEIMDRVQRADLCAVAVHLFADLLHDETPNMDIAGACLPSLKLIIDQLLASQVPTVTATTDRVLHGLLSACLSNVDEMRSRVNPVANIKIKNNLLALVLVLTALPLSVKVSKPVVEQIASDIGRYLSVGNDRPELGLTPIHCATTLLAASLRNVPGTSRPSPVLQHAAMCVLTPLITYISEAVLAIAEAEEAGSAASSDVVATALEGLGQVIRGLVAWCNGLPEDVKPRGYGILVPTLCLLLDPVGSDPAAPTAMHTLATNTLLSLAAASPKAFKDATQAMPEGERVSLERAVRDAVGARAAAKPAASAVVERKGIALKSFGA